MDYPEFVEIEGKRYKINTDFRVAIECNRVSNDNSIDDIERALAIIYLLFGEVVFEEENLKYHDKFLELALKYLGCGKKVDIKQKNKKPDMDFIKDMPFIEASFMYDFHIDLEKEKMHWWKFYDLLNGLSNSEFGNCCILNNIRNLRNRDPKEVKDVKQRQELIDAQKMFSLENNVVVKRSIEEENNIDDFLKKINIKEG